MSEVVTVKGTVSIIADTETPSEAERQALSEFHDEYEFHAGEATANANKTGTGPYGKTKVRVNYNMEYLVGDAENPVEKAKREAGHAVPDDASFHK